MNLESPASLQSTDKATGGSERSRALFVIPLGILTIVAFNFAWLNWPAQQKLSEDYRNESATVLVYHRWGIIPRQIVVDVWSVDETASRADVTRMLFHIAEQFANRDYDQVILAYKGQARLQLEGDFFNEVGRTFRYENPIYLMRTLPQHVSQIDGTQAFGSYSGGWMGVLNAQMEDLNTLHDKWWLDSELHGL